MSLLWADFPSGQPGLYGTDTSNMLDGLYAETSVLQLVNDPDPNITGNVLQFSDGTEVTDSLYRKVLPAEKSTLGLGARFYFSTLPSDNNHRPNLFEFRNADNETLLSLRINTAGTLTLINSAGTELGTSSSPVIVASAWQQVECKAVLSATVGTFECRVEGIEVAGLTLTGVNTVGSATPITCIQFASKSPSSSGTVKQFYMKDLIVWDDAGSLNNDFFGSVSVYALLTDGDVSLNWTPSTGATGYNLLDESPPDDADYISAGDPPPSPAVMSLTDLPADVTSVRGLIAIARSMKTDGGDGNLQVSMVSNAAVGSGSDRPITTAFTYWYDVFETDPDTSAAWTPAAVDDANIQFDRTL